MKIDYHLLEDFRAETLLFILEQSESELPLRRVNILLAANRLCFEKASSRELADIANELEDVEQEVQRLIGFLREKYAGQVRRDIAYEFFLAKLETCPVDTKVALLEGAQYFHALPDDFSARYMQCCGRVNRWEQQYELLKFHIRTRHHEMSNAEAKAKDTAERAAKVAAAA